MLTVVEMCSHSHTKWQNLSKVNPRMGVGWTDGSRMNRSCTHWNPHSNWKIVMIKDHAQLQRPDFPMSVISQFQSYQWTGNERPLQLQRPDVLTFPIFKFQLNYFHIPVFKFQLSISITEQPPTLLRQCFPGFYYCLKREVPWYCALKYFILTLVNSFTAKRQNYPKTLLLNLKAKLSLILSSNVA